MCISGSDKFCSSWLIVCVTQNALNYSNGYGFRVASTTRKLCFRCPRLGEPRHLVVRAPAAFHPIFHIFASICVFLSDCFFSWSECSCQQQLRSFCFIFINQKGDKGETCCGGLNVCAPSLEAAPKVVVWEVELLGGNWALRAEPS